MKRIACLAPLVAVLTACSSTPEPVPAVTFTEPAVVTTATVTTTTTATTTATATVTATVSAAPVEPAPATAITTKAAATKAAATKAAGALLYPSGDPVLAGYPVLVDTKSTDRRIQNWFKTSPKVVALAPGVYTAYSEVEPDLEAYLEGGASGDCAVRKKFFPRTGGSCWDGVKAGTQEP